MDDPALAVTSDTGGYWKVRTEFDDVMKFTLSYLSEKFGATVRARGGATFRALGARGWSDRPVRIEANQRLADVAVTDGWVVRMR